MKRLITALTMAITTATAQASYPDKSARLVLPFPTGATFLVGQTLAEVLTKELGQSFVIENRAGAGGRIAMEAVARSAADGYSLLVISPTLTITPAINPSMKFDPMQDLIPVARVAEVPNVFVANAAKFKDVDFTALQERIKKDPKSLTYGSGGAGSSNHLAFEKFKSLTAADILHIPYQGASQAVNAAVGGHIDLVINGLPNSAPLVQSGQLKAMFVLTEKRQALLPDVPSAHEIGLPDMVVTTWYGVMAPRGTDPAIVETLSAAIQRGFAQESVKQRMAEAGIDVVHEGPAEFGAFIRKDHENWKSVVKDAGIAISN